MNIDLIAKLKKYDDFISAYKTGDEEKLYNGKSLLFYSLSNKYVSVKKRNGCKRNESMMMNWKNFTRSGFHMEKF